MIFLQDSTRSVDEFFVLFLQVSYLLYDTVTSYTLEVEAVSCDELYADVSSVLRRHRLRPGQWAQHLRQVSRNSVKLGKTRWTSVKTYRWTNQ